MLVCDFLVVDTKLLKLLLGCLAPCIYSHKALFVKTYLVFIFIDRQTSSMYLEILIFKLSLIVTLKSLNIFQVLLFKSKFKVFDLC